MRCHTDAHIVAQADVSRVKYVKKVVPKTSAERTFLAESVSAIFLFADLDPSLLGDVIDAMAKKVVRAGEQIMAQGAEGDNFYVVESGSYRVLKDGRQVFLYAGSGYFGELALMYNARRSATVEATTAGVLWALDRITFRHIITEAQQKRTKVSQATLAKVAILSSVKAADRVRLGDALVAHEYADGALVIEQGAYGHNMFLIEEGTAVAYQDKPVPARGAGAPGSGGGSERHELFVHTAGDYFGERALITNEPRAASVVARGRLKVRAAASRSARATGPIRRTQGEEAYTSRALRMAPRPRRPLRAQVWTIDRAAFERLLGNEVKEKMAARVEAYRK